MMGDKLTGFYAVVTGASGGLGLAMARALLKEGAKVALAARPSEKLEKAVSSLQADGLDATVLPMDVRSEDSVAQAAARIKEQWGRIDLLINNAGIGMGRVNPWFAENPLPFFKIDLDGFRDMIETNFTGYFIVAKAFVPLMIEQGKGRFVNISTSRTTMIRKTMTPYGPSKAGAEALSNIMTEDLREYGIDVNVLLPGGSADTGLLPEESRAAFRKIPLLSPEIMVQPILFLASKDAEGLTGERIVATEFKEWLIQKGF